VKSFASHYNYYALCNRIFSSALQVDIQVFMSYAKIRLRLIKFLPW